MSAYKIALIAAIIASVEARFGQEQIPAAAISALDGQFGNSGQAATLAGSVPGSLLGATDPCDKLRLADQIVSTLGNDPAVIAAAAGLVSAEQNFNPFATTIPNICGDASLPATEALRGITPLVDPAVDNSNLANQLSASSVNNPFDANGLSVADVMIAQGFTNLAVDGTPFNGAGGNAGGNAGNNGGNNNNNGGNNNQGGNDNQNNNNGNQGGNDNQNNNQGGNNGGCDDAAGDNQQQDDNAGNNNNNQGNDNQNNNNNNQGGNNGGNAGGNAGAAGADFGLCDPRIDFVFGRPGRKADEGTFGPVDSQVGGSEALNPNIITERICDQLVNVCEANDAAVATCENAAAEVSAAGTRGPEIVDLFNNALGL